VPRRSLAAAALAGVAIVAVALGWLEDPPHLTADHAAHAAEAAFEDTGLDASVEGEPVSASYTQRTGQPVDVWTVLVMVREQPVQLQISRADARAVAIDDLTLDGTSYVLSDAEHESVAKRVDDTTLDRQLRSNIALTVAAALVVALAIAHAALATPKETT
jgi:hypothetical protein